MKRTIEDVKREIEEITERRRILFIERDALIRDEKINKSYLEKDGSRNKLRLHALNLFICGMTVDKAWETASGKTCGGYIQIARAFRTALPFYYKKYMKERHEFAESIRFTGNLYANRDVLPLEWLKQNPPTDQP